MNALIPSVQIQRTLGNIDNRCSEQQSVSEWTGRANSVTQKKIENTAKLKTIYTLTYRMFSAPNH